MAELLSILQRKLDLDPESASAQLTAYVEFVRAKAADDAGLEIQDLGTFKLQGDNLSFEPETALVSAVNYKYRSLPVITASGDRLIVEQRSESEPAELSQPVVPETELAEDESPQSYTQAELAAEVEVEVEVEADAEADESVDWEEPIVSTTEPVTEDLPLVTEPHLAESLVPELIASEPLPTEPAPEATVEQVAEQESVLSDASASIAEGITSEKEPASDLQDRGSITRKSSMRSRMVAILVPAAAVVVAGIIWFMMTDSGTQPDPSIGNPPIVENTERPVNSNAENELPDEQSAGSSVDDDEVKATETITPPPPPIQNTDPAEVSSVSTTRTDDQRQVVIPARNLTDGRSMADFPASGRVYTIMVGSTVTRAQADIHVSALPSIEFPVSVMAYETDTAAGFRVGVGLFRSVADADAVREELIDTLPQGAWVYRAQ